MTTTFLTFEPDATSAEVDAILTRMTELANEGVDAQEAFAQLSELPGALLVTGPAIVAVDEEDAS